MPSDLSKIKKIYPDSSIKFKFFKYIPQLRNNVKLPNGITVDETSPMSNWFKFNISPNIADLYSPDLQVIAPGSEDLFSGDTENLENAVKQKFMSTINDYKDIEAQWYVQYKAGTDPWCIYARSGGKRSKNKPCVGSSYKCQFKPDGTCRFGKESYFGNIDWTDWIPAITALNVDQVIGMKFVCFNTNFDQAVKLELWLDQHNNNDWKRVNMFTDYGDNWGSGASRCGCTNDRQPLLWGGPVVGFTATGNSPSNLDFLFSNTSVREINAGGNFAEATAGNATATAGPGGAFASAGGVTAEANTGGGVGNGGGGAADDTTTGTGNVNVHEPIFTVQPIGSVVTGFPFPFPNTPGTGGSGSSPIGSPSTATDQTPTAGTNQKPETPLVTVYKDLGIMYNIRLDLEDACSVGSPFEIQYRQIYSVSGGDQFEVKMFNAAGGITRAGTKAHSSASVLVNKIIRKVNVSLRRFGNPADGLVGMEIRDRLGNLMHVFDTTIDPPTIDLGAFQTFEFKSDGSKYVFQPGDMLLVTYANGTTSQDTNNCIILKHTDKDELDGYDTIFVKNGPGDSVYRVNQNEDFAAAIFI